MSTDNLPAIRHSVGDIGEMAKQVAASGLFGMNQAQLFTMMLLSQAKGIHPIQAVERYHVIQGRPAMKADAMLADFMAQGGMVEWGHHDHTKCEATFTAPRLKAPVTIAWTIEDAKKAELTKNPMWSKFSRQMLRARVISEGIRMAMPGIVAGIYTPEEVGDMEPSRSVAATVIESKPTLAPPNNNTGHGRGQYPPPDQVEDYRTRIRQFVEDRNQEWLDEWTTEQGELTEGIGEYLKVFQITAHLVKWGLKKGYLAEVGIAFDPNTGKPTEAISVAKAEKYAAILPQRHQEEFLAEIESYARDQADAARAAWRAKYEPEGADVEDEDTADVETTEAGSRG